MINLKQRLDNLPVSIWQKIAQIDDLRGQWIGSAKLHPQVLNRLKKSVLITSSGASTRIEGAHLSDSDVEKLMQGVNIQKFSDRDKQEVKGYFELLNNIFESWQTIHFREGTIQHFHKEILKYVEKDKIHRGEYKKNENTVVMIDSEGKQVGILFKTTPAYLAPKEMLELVEQTRLAFSENKYHPLLIIGNFVVEFLKIHPFTDGNGRLSRILTNFLLLKNNYAFTPYISHEKIVEKNKTEYYLALRRCQKTFGTKNETIVSWLEFFLNVVQEQAKNAVKLLSKENVEDVMSKKQLQVWKLFENPQEISAGQIQKKTGVARKTVNQILEKLLRLEKISRLGLGRSTRYRKK